MSTATAGRIMRLSEWAAERERGDDLRGFELEYAPGGSIKALPGGRIGGYLVKFNSPDRSQWKDVFTKDTDFGRLYQGGLPVYLHHAISFEDELGDMRVTPDSGGMAADARLTLATPEGREAYKAARAGRMGWSSGAVSHLCRRVPIEGTDRHRVTKWVLVEGSLTPDPADPNAVARVIDSKTPIKYLPEPERSRLLAQAAAASRKIRELESAAAARQCRELIARLERIGIRA